MLPRLFSEETAGSVGRANCAQRQLCAMSDANCAQRGCGENGQCHRETGRCQCQAGWTGSRCAGLVAPACNLGKQAAPSLQVPCAGLRKLSPVLCECLVQCLRVGDEVCGAASAGCNEDWKPPKDQPSHQSLAWNLTSRGTFHALLTCLALPAGSGGSERLSIPAPRDARLTTLEAYQRDGYGGARLADREAIPATFAGLAGLPEDVRGAGYEPTFAAGSAWVADRECSEITAYLVSRRL